MILDLLFIALLFLVLSKTKVVMPLNSFNDDFMAVKNCNLYKGFFALIVILHHISQRVSIGTLPPDFTRVGYLAVAVFLFLSGYGLQKQNLKKPDYSNGFLLKRIPAILIPYVIMTFVYWLIYTLLGDVRSFATIWHNFIANGDPIVWFSWYVVCILYFYITFYILMKIFKTNRVGTVFGSIVFCALYIFICQKLGFELWWYQTSFVFVLGIAFSSYEESIIKFIKKYYVAVLLFSLAFFVVLAKHKWEIYWLVPSLETELLLVAVLSFLFLVSFFTLSLKLKTDNKILDFLGKISFEIYMVQGALMLVLRNEQVYVQNDILWSVLVVAGSLLFAFVFNKFFSFILKKYSHLVAKLYKNQ